MDNPLIYVSLIALLIKLLGAKILYSRWYPVQAGYLIALLLFGTLLQNAIELVGYYFMHHPEHALIPYLFRLFYIALTANLILIPLSMAALIFYRLNTYWYHFAAAVFVLLTVLITASDLLIAGFQIIDFSITRLPGEYYFAYQAFILLMLAFTVYILFFAHYFAKDNYNKSKLTNLLIGFLPFALTISAVVISMALGAKLNAAALFPLMFSLFLVVLAYNFGDGTIRDLSIYVPFTKKNRMFCSIVIEVVRHIQFVDSKIDINQMQLAANKKMIMMAYKMFNGHQRNAAKFLNISESDFSKKLKKYRSQ